MNLQTEVIEALTRGTFDDAFSILGMHQRNGRLEVCALLPGALQVTLLDQRNGDVVQRLEAIDPEGLFAASIGYADDLFPYLFRVVYPAITVELEDPYRFPSMLNDDDVYLFSEGTQERLYRWMGAHPRQVDTVSGMLFVVWAPNARRVSVVGDFNQWDGRRHIMRRHPASGLWEIFIPGLGEGALYKYEIRAANGDLLPLKADPYGFAAGPAGDTASRTVGEGRYRWRDRDWIEQRASHDPYRAPLSVYEVHAGSWRRKAEEENRFLTYRELADELVPYVSDMGFSHVQFMPLSEFPFDGSWGYQPIGLFAPTSRFGSPDDLRYLVDRCHAAGIGVILDWVPGHFPTDEHGLGRFDGSALYEHEDPRQGFHPDWNTLIYNYARREVVSFLLSNAMYWLDEFHIDGLRVDAVASMLYLDYSRKQGEWIANREGGRENLDAIELLRQVNSRVYFNFPGVMMIAEESTAFPAVSQPVSNGGIGFGFKWNMGWMNDTLEYLQHDPIHRKYHHDEMTFSLLYAFSENFILPLSHDEVVHGKRSLVNKMPGDEWQRFANLRALLGFMWTHPGKKLLFMGGEFAQYDEWNHNKSLDWQLTGYERHAGVQRLVTDLNRLYRELPALHQLDCDSKGFEWVDATNRDYSVFSFLRRGQLGTHPVLVVINLTPTPHQDYRVGVPLAGKYQQRFNSDHERYGGSGMDQDDTLQTSPDAWGNFPVSLQLTLPPLAVLILEAIE